MAVISTTCKNREIYILFFIVNVGKINSRARKNEHATTDKSVHTTHVHLYSDKADPHKHEIALKS